MKRILIIIIIIIIITFLVLCINICSATNYHVNTSWAGASDSNNGLADSNTSAWKTISKCTSTLTAGHTCVVHAGTYDESITESTSGNATHWISFTTDGEVDIVSGVVKLAGNYINFSGDWVTTGGVHSTNKSHTILSGIAATTTGVDCISIGGQLNDIIIENNTCLGDSTYTHGITYQMPSPQAWRAHNITIRYNTIGNYSHNGIDINSNTQDVNIENNTIWDCGGQDAIMLHNYNMYRVNVKNNLIYMNFSGANAQGIGLTGIQDSVIEDNTFIGTGDGRPIVFEAISPIDGQDGFNNNITVRNNNFSGTFEYVIEIYATSTRNSNILFDSNIGDKYWFVGTGGTGNNNVTIRDPGLSPISMSTTSNPTDSKIEYTDGSVSSGNLIHYPTNSSKEFTSAVSWVRYNMTVMPSFGYAMVTTDGMNLTINQNISDQPTINHTTTIYSNNSGTQVIFNISTGKANTLLTLNRNGSYYIGLTTNSTGWFNYRYTGGFSTYKFQIIENASNIGNLSGYIYSIDSNPIENAMVFISHLNGSYLATVNTSVDGSYNFTNVNSSVQYYIFTKWINESSAKSDNFSIISNSTVWQNLTVIQTQTMTSGQNVFVNLSGSFDFEGDALTYSCNRTDLFTDFNITKGTGNWIPSGVGDYSIKFGASDDIGFSNKTIIFNVSTAVNTSTIIIPANSWGMINNWTLATTFTAIAANESNDVCYSYYNVTSKEWESHYPPHSWNSDYDIPLWASVFVFVGAETTITSEIKTIATIDLFTGWNQIFIIGTDNETIADIKADIGVYCSDVWWFNSTTGIYSNTSTDTVQPCQGMLPYITQNFTWVRSDL